MDCSLLLFGCSTHFVCWIGKSSFENSCKTKKVIYQNEKNSMIFKWKINNYFDGINTQFLVNLLQKFKMNSIILHF